MNLVARNILAAGTIVLAVAGCSDNSSEFYEGTGTLNISIEITPNPNSDFVPSPADFYFYLEYAPTAAQHTWTSFADFNQGERFLTGEYTAAAVYGVLEAEGFDSPYYYALSTFTLTDSGIDLTLQATVGSIPVRVTTTEAFSSALPECSAIVHSAGGGFVEFVPGETRIAYMRNSAISLSLTFEGGETLRLATDTEGISGHEMSFVIDYDATTKCVTTALDGTTISTQKVDESTLSSIPVSVAPSLSEPITLCEFNQPESPMTFNISSEGPIQELLLNIDSRELMLLGLSGQLDLVNPTEPMLSVMKEAGLQIPTITEQTRSVTVDVTPLLRHIPYNSLFENVTVISMSATNAAGRITGPVAMTVNTVQTRMEITAVEGAQMGVDSSRVTFDINTNQLDGLLCFTDIATGLPLPITSFTANGGSSWTCALELPDGNKAIDVVATYGGVETARFSIARLSPEYSLEVDAYATRLWVKIKADNAELVEYLTHNLDFYVNNKSAAVYSRLPEQGLVSVIGLDANSRYTLKTTLFDSLSDGNCQQISFTTEKAVQVPNNDFDTTVKRAVYYTNLDSGGLYSQTITGISTRQNKVSYELQVPEKWANTNAKTFAMGSSNHNTWYMQPSVYTVEDVYSGDYAVEIVSTAFDPNGQEIPSYTQTGLPYVDYSRNIPDIAYRAAGKIFLGSYSYNPHTVEETYTEGIDFESRPTSLNGFYKYTPSQANLSDHGLVIIELLGTDSYGSEVTIASVTEALPIAANYTAFSVSIPYSPGLFIKAKRLKLMIASSNAVGTIAEETAEVVTYDNPETSTSLGSRLTLDGLSFAY